MWGGDGGGSNEIRKKVMEIKDIKGVYFVGGGGMGMRGMGR